MKSPSLSRILSTVLLVFAVPLAQAEEPPRAHGAASFSSVLEILGRAWGGIVSLWAENGAILDPDGLGAAGPGESSAESACDNGAILDPSGGCRSGS